MAHENEQKYARLANEFLVKHSIAPTPEHYAVGYHFAEAKNRELIREIEAIAQNKLAFDAKNLSYLYNKYVVGSGGEKTVDQAAASAQNVLMEVLKAINDFSGETQTYNKGVDQYMDTVTKKFEGTPLQSLVKELVQTTTDLKQSGEKISKKLAESTKEITNLKKNLQQVTVESQRDSLTNVFNRKTFEKFFDEQAELAKTKKTDLCLLMIDIDHFKQFNDKFGHLLGDEVLKTVARTLVEILKGRDVVARFGGEEFIVMLPETPIEGALKVAEAIRGSIAGKELTRKDTGQHFGAITVSMGVARFRLETDTLPTLIKRADDALYQSKHDGRNRVTREA